MWATSPIVASRWGTGEAADTNSHTLSYPAGVVSGDMVIFAMSCRHGSQTLTWPAGVTQLYQENTGVGGTADVKFSAAYRRANGTEGASITVTSDDTTSCGLMAWRLTNAHASSNPEAAWTNTGGAQGSTPDPPNLPPSWGSDSDLWIAIAGWESSTTVTLYPTGYSATQTYNSTGAQGQARIASGEKTSTATSENPGTFTLSAVAWWGASTVGIRGAAPSTCTGGMMMRGAGC